jgi:hypothetical protein
MDEAQVRAFLDLPTYERQASAVNDAVEREIEAGEFSYMRWFSLHPALQTMGMEALDRVIRTREHSPLYGQGGDPLNIRADAKYPIVALRLADGVFSPTGAEVKILATRNVRRLGRLGTEREEYEKSFGPFALVDDAHPARCARVGLWRHGWPRAGNGPTASTVLIDWLWLAGQLRLAERDQVHGAAEVHAACLQHEGFDRFLAELAGDAPVPMTPPAAPTNGKRVRA